MTYLSRVEEVENELQLTMAAIRELRVKYDTLKAEFEAMTHKSYTHLADYSNEVITANIIQAVIDATGVFRSDLLSRKRDRLIVTARQVATYLIKEYTSYYLSEIGRHLSNGKGQNHATVMHSIKQVESAYWSYNKTKQNNDLYCYSEMAKDIFLSTEIN